VLEFNDPFGGKIIEILEKYIQVFKQWQIIIQLEDKWNERI
jgi:hypothetical protein